MLEKVMVFPLEFSFSFRLALLGSLLLHGLVFGGLAMRSHAQLISLPLGSLFPKQQESFSVDFVSQTPQKTAAHPVHEGDVLVQKSRQKTTPVVAQQTTAPSGPSTQLGVEKGKANADAMAHYLMGLRQQIEKRKIYPSQSKRMGETGRVLVSLDVFKDGRLSGVKIKDPSPYTRLNEAALKTVAGVSQYQPLPDSVSQDKLTVEVPLEFTL